MTVADHTILKLLLVEDDLEDECILREALIEIEEQRQWGNWRTCELVHVDQFGDALDCIRHSPFDVVLLNLSLPDAPSALDTLLQAAQCSSGTPIIVLADEDDPALAQRLIREGAQDVIVKPEIECAPLARAIRHAIERSRRWATLESRFFRDELTGAFDRTGFLFLASLCLRQAAANGLPMALVLVDFHGASDSESDSDLWLIRAAEVGLFLFPEASLIGRLDGALLGVLIIGRGSADATEVALKLREDIRSAFPNGEPRVAVVARESREAGRIDELLVDCQRKLAIPAMLAD